ncbi:MAG: class I SAM-dependent methyltransferase [Chloroflexales bacterium]|nr:class I SAM-dependent methyltransferase [Chloroflexales bacterium]
MGATLGAMMHTPSVARTPTHPRPAAAYFDLQATWGLTKHFGGTTATDTLLSRCGVGPETRLLEVGCGVGITPCHAARTLGCQVVAVDLSERMLTWAHRRAWRLRLDRQVSLAAADAQALPFPDDSFDAVICESVLAFVPDPTRALAEYRRVARPGGAVGVTEGVWLRPPPPALESYLARALGGARFLPPDGWAALLGGAGLGMVSAERHRIGALDQWRDDLSRLDAADLLDYARAWRSFLTGLATSPALRRYVRTVWPSSPSIFRVFDSFGYGIFVGRKETPPR